jgi:hypothetical protein
MAGEHRRRRRKRHMVSLTEWTAASECVACTVADHVATITLDRPERRNALNYR